MKLSGFANADIRSEPRETQAEQGLRISDWKPGAGGKTIEQLYAWVATEPSGEQAIICMSIQGVQWPLVGANRERMESLGGYVEEIAKLSGRPTQFVVFERKPL